jgi:predicted transcriptional regulator
VASARATSSGRAEQRAPRTGTKQALLVGMLTRDSGASIRELVEGTGWKANTSHAALSTLRTSGRHIVVEEVGTERRYGMKAD